MSTTQVGGVTYHAVPPEESELSTVPLTPRDSRAPSSLQNKQIAPVRNQNISQTLLMGMTTVCALLSIIPPLRLGASLALRSVAFLAVSFANTPDKPEAKAIKAVKLAAVVLGIIGLAAALPALLIASLGVDMGIQVAGIIRSLHDGNYVQALVHLAVFIIDTLALAGLATGSWELMAVSMIVTAVMMVTGMAGSWASITPYDDDATRTRKVLTGIAFLALIGISTAGTITTFEWTEPHRVCINNRLTWQHVVTKNPLDPSLFGTLPVGGNALPMEHPNAIVGWTEAIASDNRLTKENELWAQKRANEISALGTVRP